VAEGTVVGDAGGSSVSVGAGAVQVADGGTVEVAVGVKVGLGGKVLVGVAGGGAIVGGGAVGTVCALAEPTQPGALPATIPTARTMPAATRTRGDRRMLPWNMVSSFTRSKPSAQGTNRGLSRCRQQPGQLTARDIQQTMPA